MKRLALPMSAKNANYRIIARWLPEFTRIDVSRIAVARCVVKSEIRRGAKGPIIIHYEGYTYT